MTRKNYAKESATCEVDSMVKYRETGKSRTMINESTV